MCCAARPSATCSFAARTGAVLLTAGWLLARRFPYPGQWGGPNLHRLRCRGMPGRLPVCHGRVPGCAPALVVKRALGPPAPCCSSGHWLQPCPAALSLTQRQLAARRPASAPWSCTPEDRPSCSSLNPAQATTTPRPGFPARPCRRRLCCRALWPSRASPASSPASGVRAAACWETSRIDLATPPGPGQLPRTAPACPAWPSRACPAAPAQAVQQRAWAVRAAAAGQPGERPACACMSWARCLPEHPAGAGTGNGTTAYNENIGAPPCTLPCTPRSAALGQSEHVLRSQAAPT